MFLHMSVILSTGRGYLYDVTSYLAAWSHVPSGEGVSIPGPLFLLGSLCVGRSLSTSQGVSVQVGLCLGGLCPGEVSLQRVSLFVGGLCRETPESEKLERFIVFI